MPSPPNVISSETTAEPKSTAAPTSEPTAPSKRARSNGTTP